MHKLPQYHRSLDIARTEAINPPADSGLMALPKSPPESHHSGRAERNNRTLRSMAAFTLLVPLALPLVVRLAPLMLPGALVALVVLGIAELARRHHEHSAHVGTH